MSDAHETTWYEELDRNPAYAAELIDYLAAIHGDNLPEGEHITPLDEDTWTPPAI